MVEVIELKSVDEFHDFINERDGKLRICRLMASWCGPCKVLGETIKNLDIEAVKGSLFAKVDIDSDATEDIATECGVRGVPVLLFYKDGEEKKRTFGAMPAAEIYKIIDELA